MQKELIEAHSTSDFALAFVWIPMVPTDNFNEARREAKLRISPRVRHFYDADRLLGLTYASTIFVHCADEALRVLPADHELRDQLQSWAQYPSRERALWDAVLIYPAGDTWSDGVPAPKRWAKQVAFFVDQHGKAGGVFWADDCARLPHESDWFAKVRDLTSGAID